MSDSKVRTSFYLQIYATGVVGLCLVGMNLAGFNQSAVIVSARQGWKTSLPIALVNDACVVGLMIGSLIADNLLSIGVKNTAMLANVIGIIGCLPQLSDNFWALMVGKIILGFGGGILIVATSVYVAQSLPN